MRHKPRKSQWRAAILVTFATMLVVLFIAWTFSDIIVPAAGSVELPPDFSAFATQAQVRDLPDTGYLQLVDRDMEISAPLDHSRLATLWPGIPVRATYITVQETAATALSGLFAAASQAGYANLFIASGYRSYDQQRTLYMDAADRAYAAPPGHSEHQLGLAVDILISDSDNMRGTDEAAWLAANAPIFGFVLSYPEDKQDVTGTPYEPWHFRYVGRVHAWFMGQQNFVLTEYIAHLQEIGGYIGELDGRIYYVLYQRPQNGMIFVPEHMEFQLSSANTGAIL